MGVALNSALLDIAVPMRVMMSKDNLCLGAMVLASSFSFDQSNSLEFFHDLRIIPKPPPTGRYVVQAGKVWGIGCDNESLYSD